MMAVRNPTIALVGNPNTGKTTLFNALAGMNQRVGNYPGVTVETKKGKLHIADRTLDLIDLGRLRSNAQVFVDDAKTAFLCQSNGSRRLRHRVHGSTDQRNVE